MAALKRCSSPFVATRSPGGGDGRCPWRSGVRWRWWSEHVTRISAAHPGWHPGSPRGALRLPGPRLCRAAACLARARSLHCGHVATAVHRSQQEDQDHLARHRPPRRCLAGDRLTRAARQPAGQCRDAAPGRGRCPRAQLQGRPPRLQPAHAALGHAGAAAVRGPDPGRVAHQPVLPVDGRLDHPRLRARGPGPADLVPAAVRRLARRLRGQHEGRRPDPARLRRLPGLPGQAREAGRAGHAFRPLGRGAAGPAGACRSAATTSTVDAWPASTWSAWVAARIAFLGGASSHCPEFFDRFPRLRRRAARSGRGDGGDPAGRRGELRGRRLQRRRRTAASVAARSTRCSPPAT